MYRRILLYFISVVLAQAVIAQTDNTAEQRSRRSSICSILIKHDDQKFADEIEKQFSLIPVSERYNDHNLSVRVVNAGKKKITGAEVDKFVKDNQLASRLVARWFDRNILTGECSLDTVRSRGLYDASAFDRELAKRSARGTAMLEDAGEDLIGNTFLLINEANYVDKSKRSKIWGIVGGVAMGALAIASGSNVSDATDFMKNTASIISSYKGFTVKITTRLYRLVWDEESSARFYKDCYTTKENNAKKEAFEKMRPDFKLEYVGEVVSKGGRTSFLGIREEEPELMVRKACARAIDENIVDLQRRYEQFRIKTPISSVSPVIKARIGRKEGVTADTEFEVLEAREKNGKITYHRVGVVKPVPTQIWDNRFMADAEGAKDSDLGATSFKKKSGGDFYPGMLLREIN